MFQIVDEFRHVFITAVRTFLGTFQNDLLQSIRKIRRILGRRLDLFLQMFDRDRDRGIPVEGNTACHHFVQCDTKRINITLVIRISAPHLLRGTVMNTPHHVRTDRVGRSRFCNTEIGKFYLSVGGNDNILRFNVPMNDPSIVSGLQAQGDLDRDTGRLLDTQFTLSINIILQRDPFHKFHDNIVHAAVLADVIHIDHVWMGQAGGRLRFGTEL